MEQRQWQKATAAAEVAIDGGESEKVKKKNNKMYIWAFK